MGQPSIAEYWHMGLTTMRFVSSTERTRKGTNMGGGAGESDAEAEIPRCARDDSRFAGDDGVSPPSSARVPSGRTRHTTAGGPSRTAPSSRHSVPTGAPPLAAYHASTAATSAGSRAARFS